MSWHAPEENEECNVLTIREWIDFLSGFYDQYGYTLVFLGSLGENTAALGLVLPGGTLALLGAVYARVGTLNLGWVIFSPGWGLCLAIMPTISSGASS
jgi:membrane protein DedA with SNARE-associated domain